MTIARILALIPGREGDEAPLDAALDLGRKFAARVELLHVEQDVDSAPPVIGEGMSGAALVQITESLRAEAKRNLEAARGLFERRCESVGLPLVEPDSPAEPGKFAVSFHHVVGREADEVKRRGRLCDLIVLGRGAGNGAGPSAAFDAALFDSARPVLLVPPGRAEGIGEKVAVAWNGTREAVRATSAALPILEEAEKVVVLTARDGDTAAEPSELVDYLHCHGIEAHTWAFTPQNGSIGKALLAETDKAGAGLLVMGGYGHTRFREMVLGGATRSVLAGAKIPILMAH